MITIYVVGLILSMMFFDWVYKQNESYIIGGYQLAPVIRIITLGMLWFLVVPTLLIMFVLVLINSNNNNL